jgi:DNA-binding NtrC family response regulator
MARSRRVAADLARLLSAAPEPIYVLDDEQTLVFCNQACLDWVDRTSDELVGSRSTYHTSPDPSTAEAVAAGLCPSPEAFAGRETTGIVASATCDGRLRRRRARFVPLGAGPGGPVGLIVLVGAEDLPESEPLSPEAHPTEAAWLHEQVRQFRHQLASRFRVDRLAGSSPAMRRARSQVALAARSKASVLVVGPPGSGRRHVAGAIHYGTPPESSGSIIPLACSLLDAELIHSTVVALAARKPAADPIRPATLLLNDADRLPAEVQAEMAAVLGARSFPLRPIATATRTLGDLAREGKYRADLAAVLSTVVIELPPLAERREDLPMLAQLFLEEANVRGSKQVAGFSPEALDRLDGYPWPGNLDELAQFVAEAHKRAEGFRIEVGDLSERIHWAAQAAAHPRRSEEKIVLDEFLARIERELIERAMREAKGNKTKAAELLGMTRPRLYRRLVQLGLEK